MSTIPLSQPDITDLEVDAVVDVLRSGRLSIGPEQERFEAAVAQAADRGRGVAVSSGTAGLHLALLALGVGPGDEVITTPFSFIASANTILMVGAKPVFVDVCPRSLNLEPERVEAAITERTKAVMAVEVFGNSTHMAALEKVCAKRDLFLIEDCCEGLGGVTAQGRQVGSFGRVSVFGFYPNKQITTGEGGMIVTDDDRLADMCVSLRNQGRSTVAHTGSDAATGSWLSHERLGYNYRLSELAAALGNAQMQRLPELLERRRRVATGYFQRLMDQQELVLPTCEPGTDGTCSWFVFVLRLASDFDHVERDRILNGLKRHDIGASNYFPCIHLQPFYRDTFGHAPGEFPIAERASQRTIALPFHTGLDDTQLDLVCNTLRLMLGRASLSRS